MCIVCIVLSPTGGWRSAKDALILVTIKQTRQQIRQYMETYLYLNRFHFFLHEKTQ